MKPHAERNFLIHPQEIIIYLLLAGVTSLFFGFSISYLYNRIQAGIAPVDLPPLFYLNSFLLIGSSFSLIRAKRSYLDDETEQYQLMLIVTFMLTSLFLVMQIMAWKQLLDNNISLTHSNLASYMYVISALHFAHVIGGLPFLAYFIWQSKKFMKEPVTVLIYFSDPDKKRRLKLLTIYWHLLDALWIYLVVFFLLNFLIQ